MKEEYSKCLEQNLSVMQTISGLTSLSARINDMCGRTRLSEYSAIQAVLKGSAIWDVAKPKCSAGARPQSKVFNIAAATFFVMKGVAAARFWYRS